MNIGILDVQGSVEEHYLSLQKCGINAVLVKTKNDLEKVKGLIIPGGESTTIGKLLRRFGLREEIIKRANNGMPIWGTCAGAILLAKKIIGKQMADSLNLMDITIERNAYGRQMDSFETEIEIELDDKNVRKIPAIFIRAPKISEVGENVKILAKYENKIIAAKEKNLLATTFHPELTEDLSVHKYFVEMCRS